MRMTRSVNSEHVFRNVFTVHGYAMSDKDLKKALRDSIDVDKNDGDLIGIAAEGDPYLGAIDRVDAICRSMDGPIFWKLYKKWGYVLTFSVVEPSQYMGAKLRMFARWDKSWNGRLPRSSKLYKCACVAVGRRIDRGHRITKSLFLNQIFRCDVTSAGNGPAAYSKIDMITRRLTGLTEDVGSISNLEPDPKP
jgi:hypothetical protein